jgi:CRP-like cAMP-binding protein
MSTHARRELRELGGLLRQARPLQGLTDAEAAVLVTFMQRLDVPAGAVLIRQGEVGDDLFVVLSGDAEVFVRDPMQRPVSVGRLGPGDHFGEIALVMGGARSADVVALTPMTLMKITKELYRQYLGYMADVQVELHCAATSRLRDTQHCQSQASD